MLLPAKEKVRYPFYIPFVVCFLVDISFLIILFLYQNPAFTVDFSLNLNTPIALWAIIPFTFDKDFRKSFTDFVAWLTRNNDLFLTLILLRICPSALNIIGSFNLTQFLSCEKLSGLRIFLRPEFKCQWKNIITDNPGPLCASLILHLASQVSAVCNCCTLHTRCRCWGVVPLLLMDTCWWVWWVLIDVNALGRKNRPVAEWRHLSCTAKRHW